MERVFLNYNSMIIHRQLQGLACSRAGLAPSLETSKCWTTRDVVIISNRDKKKQSKFDPISPLWTFNLTRVPAANFLQTFQPHIPVFLGGCGLPCCHGDSSDVVDLQIDFFMLRHRTEEQIYGTYSAILLQNNCEMLCFLRVP